MKHDSDILKRIKSYFMRRKSADEAHAFEKEAEKDAFLYEAMEGFEGMLTSDIQQAMDELDDRIDATSNKFLFPIDWRIAASILAFVTIGASLYFTVFNSSSNENAVSKNEDEIYEPRSGETQFDTLGTYAFQYEEPIKSQDSIAQLNELENVYANNDEKAVTTPQIEEITNASSQSKLKEETASSFNWEDEGVNDENAIISNETDASISDDFEVAAAEAESADLMLEEAEMTMPSKTEMKRAAPMDATEKEESGSIAKPKSGMSEYQSYVKKNLNSSEGMPAGNVVLTFELDRNGKPKKITVVKSLCTACDAEAIRLVENGPEWKAADKKAKGTVSIQFP